MKRGFVYKLSGGGKFYIGSTSLTPELRIAEHKAFSVKPESQRQPVYRHFVSIGWDNVTVETLRECQYETKRDLLQYEREEYDKVATDPCCLNVNRPSITRDELKQQVKANAAKWHQENKERCRERLKQWRVENPDKVKEQVARRVDKARGEQRARYERNPEAHRETLRKWREENPEKYAEQKKRSAQRQTEKRRKAREAEKQSE
jgi:hypothetical protein